MNLSLFVSRQCFEEILSKRKIYAIFKYLNNFLKRGRNEPDTGSGGSRLHSSST
jgi:hypothetical protein